MTSFSGIRASLADTELWARDVTEWSRRVMRGKLNNTALFTMTANAASTTFADERIGLETQIVFSPTTANAAAALTSTFVAEGARGNGTVVVTHPNDSNTDKTYRVSFHG
jgi:hypothetical protein